MRTSSSRSFTLFRRQAFVSLFHNNSHVTTRAAHSGNSISITTNYRTPSSLFHSARSLLSEKAEETPKETKEEPKEEAGKKEKEEAGKKEASEGKDYEALLKEKDQKIKESQEKMLRTLADMQNLRDRVARDSENAKKYAISKFAKDLLDVADTLELALKAAEADLAKGDNPQLKSFQEGIVLTKKTLLNTYKRHGVSKFDSLGEKFDPQRHEGLFEFVDPEKEVGTVGQVVKEGWMIKDVLLRAAQVGTVKSG